jgi:hypothetical protein
MSECITYNFRSKPEFKVSKYSKYLKGSFKKREDENYHLKNMEVIRI